MERDTSIHGSWSPQPHSQVPNGTSASSEQGLTEEAHTAVNHSSTNGALAPANGAHANEMEVFDEEPQHFHAQYSTELKPDLKERHTNMIAFSTIVGIGFFLQAGRVTYLAGPGLAWIAYILTGTAVWAAIASLGEMIALFPIKGGVFEFPRRFVDAGIGYACGWMSWFAWVVILAAEVTTIAHLFQFKFEPSYLQQFGYSLGSTIEWKSTENISPAVFVTLWLLFILAINLLRVRWYGEIEYWIGVSKMFFFVGLILFNIINNARTRTYFEYYQHPYGFESNGFTSSHGVLHGGGSGHFAAMGTAMITTIFSMIGFEVVSITAPENRDRETGESIKLATRKISLRIILLYALATFVAGMNVPYNDSQLVDTSVSAVNNGAKSIFVIAAVRDGVKGFPSFFNAFFIFSATSAGFNSLYVSSRLLHALANTPEVWPSWYISQSLRRRLERTSDSGVPRSAVLTSWLFGWLGLLATKTNTAQIIGRMAINSSVSVLIVYTINCGAYLSFFFYTRRVVRGEVPHGLDPQQDSAAYDREDRTRYPYRSHWQYLRAVYGMVFCGLMAFFNGWRSIEPWAWGDFVASYISIIVFVILSVAYHVKIDNTWNPRWWRIRRSEDLSNPKSIFAPDPRLRRGKLHRQNKDRFLSQENLKAFKEWIWVWTK